MPKSKRAKLGKFELCAKLKYRLGIVVVGKASVEEVKLEKMC
jgi:hypothetical protein